VGWGDSERYPEPGLNLGSHGFVKAGDGFGLVSVHVENGQKFRDLQQVMHFPGKVEQFQSAALV
jgi:hypothetical protein